jgi:GST-like protein
MRGGGSAIVELMLAAAKIPFERIDLEWEDLGPGSATLRNVNPLGQIPTLMLEDRSVLTESAAMTLWIGDRTPEAGLVPAADHAGRATFLRWLAFLVAQVYPTFTYGDVPERWVHSADAGKQLRASTDAWRERLWKQVDLACAASPWFLGETRTAIDFYLAVMVHWRPRREWFRRECAHIDAVAKRLETDPTFGAILDRHFSGKLE